MAFIFDPSKGETPESLRKKREIAEALRANAMGLATSPGEGLAMIGAAIGSRMADGRARKAAAFGQQQASSAMAPILAAFGGGSPAPSTPTPSVNNNVPIGKADPVQSVMDAAPKAAAGGDWLKYANSGATRNLPLSDNLKGALGFLPELGVTMEVFSGGQPAKGSGKPRVGSTRHDHGNAADVFFYKDGKRLNWANPQDRPIFEEIVRRGKANGITGFGAGDGYMQPGSMHIGFGSNAVWGAGGRGANAPDWLRAAYNGAPAGRSSPAAQAVTAMAQGGQTMPQVAPQAAPQPMPRSGGAMDVWRGMADQGVASDGSQLVRTPDGVQRTSTKGYTEIIRPEGKPSDREPMPMRGQRGGMGAILSSLLGRGGQSQVAPQVMTQMAPQQVAALPMQPQRQPVPQNQPPIPGIQPTPAAPQPAPVQPQMAPQPASAAPQAGMNGLGLPQLLQIAQNPWVAENKLYSGIINTLIENQLNMNKPMNPMEKAQLEKLLIETEQLRNPVAKPTGDMTEYDLYVEQATAAGQTPMPFLEYQQALKKAGATNVTVGDGAPGLGKLSTDYGYRLGPDGKPIIGPDGLPVAAPIPGSPAAKALEDAAKQAEIGRTSQARSGNVVIEDIDRALAAIEDSSLPTAGAVGGALSNIPGTQAYDVGALIQTVKANSGFDRLQAMRDASPTGGALGAINESEMRLLQSALGNLEQSQSKEQLQYNLKRVRKIYDEIVNGPSGAASSAPSGPVVVDGYTIEQVD